MVHGLETLKRINDDAASPTMKAIEPHPEPEVESPWYTEMSVASLIRAEHAAQFPHQFDDQLSIKMIPFITKHLNLAFEKGRQIGRGERDA